jgi:hypothetical protein
MKHALAAALAVLILLAGALTLGRDSPVRLAENAASPSAADASIHAYGDREPTCREWTDGCRVCSRPDTGAPVCSNIPIACQPAAITCARRTEPAK